MYACVYINIWKCNLSCLLQNSTTLPRLVTVNNLTYSKGEPDQSLLSPHQPSYVDYFWVSFMSTSNVTIIPSGKVVGAIGFGWLQY